MDLGCHQFQTSIFSLFAAVIYFIVFFLSHFSIVIHFHPKLEMLQYASSSLQEVLKIIRVCYKLVRKLDS